MQNLHSTFVGLPYPGSIFLPICAAMVKFRRLVAGDDMSNMVAVLELIAAVSSVLQFRATSYHYTPEVLRMCRKQVYAGNSGVNFCINQHLLSQALALPNCSCPTTIAKTRCKSPLPRLRSRKLCRWNRITHHPRFPEKSCSL